MASFFWYRTDVVRDARTGRYMRASHCTCSKTCPVHEMSHAPLTRCMLAAMFTAAMHYAHAQAAACGLLPIGKQFVGKCVGIALTALTV